MADPSRRSSRLAIAAGSAAAIAMAAAGFTVGRSTAPAPPPLPSSATAPEAPPEPPAPPAPPRVLGRAELLAAAAAAADAFAAGTTDAGTAEPIDGLRFTLRLPIGCGGASDDETVSGWSYDPATKALRVRAVPARWTPAEWAGEGVAIEAIEGFWIAQPWTSSEACSTAPAALAPAAPAGEAPAEAPARPSAPERTLAIAQFFEKGSSRIGRRGGEALEAVIRQPVETLDTSKGFRLRIEGRAARGPGGRAFVCRAAGEGRRPVCLISASLDTLAIENGATGETLATWALSTEGAVPSVE